MANLKQIIWAFRYRRAVRRADSLAKEFNMKYFVLLSRGRLICVPKQNLKRLIRERRFRSGTTIADIEKIALYVTR